MNSKLIGLHSSHDCFVTLQGSLATLNGFFGSGTGPILLDSIMCLGNESQLLQCTSVQHLGQHDCGLQKEAGVICPGTYINNNIKKNILYSHAIL